MRLCFFLQVGRTVHVIYFWQISFPVKECSVALLLPPLAPFLLPCKWILTLRNQSMKLRCCCFRSSMTSQHSNLSHHAFDLKPLVEPDFDMESRSIPSSWFPNTAEVTGARPKRKGALNPFIYLLSSFIYYLTGEARLCDQLDIGLA